MTDAGVLSTEEQVVRLLSSSPDVLNAMRVGDEDDNIVASRIVDQPLKRANDDHPLLIANDPTPQCFEPEPPHWLLPSVSVGLSTLMATEQFRSSRYLPIRILLAYYASSDVANVVLWQMRGACASALHKEVVVMPDGTGMFLWVQNDLTMPVPVPEFPGAGKVMLERISATGVWRRS